LAVFLTFYTHFTSSSWINLGMFSLSMFSTEKSDSKKYMNSFVRLWYLDLFAFSMIPVYAVAWLLLDVVFSLIGDDDSLHFMRLLMEELFLAVPNCLLLSRSFITIFVYKLSMVFSSTFEGGYGWEEAPELNDYREERIRVGEPPKLFDWTL
jgi:hypothetical protein